MKILKRRVIGGELSRRESISKEVTQVRVINDRYSRVRASKTEIYGLCVFPRRERVKKREGKRIL